MVLFTPLHEAGIAQLVEQLICNQQVVGSNPSAGSDRSILLVVSSCRDLYFAELLLSRFRAPKSDFQLSQSPPISAMTWAKAS